MKHLGLVTLLGLFLITAACEDNDVLPTGQGLVGTWQLYETGGSLGFNYSTTPVPSVPAQTLTFSSNGSVTTQGDQLSFFGEFKRYRLVSDSIQTMDYVALSGSNTNEFAVYITRLTPDSLIVNPPCDEGCHYGFVRVKTPSPSKDL